ncbi:sigma-54 interaction domain-containing protein [Fusobacterium sp. PH5-44]|uniref:sigma-54 interaction domain-containing protein n=1 Tax=unclassified Fusobacterium TaxID=2648384 RepID=UPI003D20B5A5
MEKYDEVYKYIFEQVLKMTDDGFIVIDNEGIIMNINDQYCNFFSKGKDEIIGQNIINLIPNSKMIDIIKKKYKEEGAVHTYFEGTKNEKKAIVNRSYVEDDGGRIIAGVAQVKFRLQTLDIAQKLTAEYEQLEYYKEEYQRYLTNNCSFDNIIGSSSSFLKTKIAANKASRTNFSVLITGETGTGKGVFARAIHNNSSRANKPMVTIDCTSIPDELLESELFGYREGAFTGAKKGGKKGKFCIAHGGTVFLDEIGDMPLKMQGKLLHVLQEKEVNPIGSLKAIPINVRIIAATRKNIHEMVKSNEFREDLFYRLNVINIEMIPLRERRDDIIEIAHSFLNMINNERKTSKVFSKDVLRVFKEYNWPGNVRELDNIIKSAYASSDNSNIELSDLPSRIVSNNKIDEIMINSDFYEMMDNYEKKILEVTLKSNNWNIMKAAKELNLHRSVIYKKIKKYNLKENIL